MVDQLRQKYTIFTPVTDDKTGNYGNRHNERLKGMFNPAISSELIDPVKILEIARKFFNPEEEYEGDQGFWQNGKVSRYGLATNNGDTRSVLFGSRGLPGGTHYPNVASAPNADPNNLPEPPSPAPNYNNIADQDYNTYNRGKGVLSPSASSPKVKVTLGQALKIGKSNAT